MDTVKDANLLAYYCTLPIEDNAARHILPLFLQTVWAIRCLCDFSWLSFFFYWLVLVIHDSFWLVIMYSGCIPGQQRQWEQPRQVTGREEMIKSSVEFPTGLRPTPSLSRCSPALTCACTPCPEQGLPEAQAQMTTFQSVVGPWLRQPCFRY